MESVLGLALTASQAVIHVLLRDLTNYYYYKDMAETHRLNMLATMEPKPPAETRKEFIASVISEKDSDDNYENIESSDPREGNDELITCNKFVSCTNQECNRNEDIIGDILNEESKGETTAVAQNAQDCHNSEVKEDNNQTEFFRNYLQAGEENTVHFCENLEKLDKEENTQSYKKETVNTTSFTPDSTNYEQAKRLYCFSELFSNVNTPAKQAEKRDEIEDCSSEITSETISCPSSEKDVNEKDDSELEKEEKPYSTKSHHQSTECHPCILDNYVWSSEENIDKLDQTNDQCVPEVNNQNELNSITFKEPVNEHNDLINENISQPSGVIECFSDIESSCYDEEWATRLLAELNKDCAPIKIEDVKTESVKLESEENEVESLKNETDFHESESNKTYKKSDGQSCDCSKVHSCLQVVDCDDVEEDELLTEDQLGSVETGSVSDWLYTVMPAGCWLSANDIIQVSPEELREIDDEEHNQELEDTIIKKLFINKWLENMSMYCDPCLKYACGDYEAK